MACKKDYETRSRTFGITFLYGKRDHAFLMCSKLCIYVLTASLLPIWMLNFFSSLQALFGLPFHRVDLIAGYDPSIFSCILYFQLIWRIVSVLPLTLQMHRSSNNLTDVRPTQLVQSFGCTKIGGSNYLLADNDGNQPKLCPFEGPWRPIAIWYTVLM